MIAPQKQKMKQTLVSAKLIIEIPFLTTQNASQIDFRIIQYHYAVIKSEAAERKLFYLRLVSSDSSLNTL